MIIEQSRVDMPPSRSGSLHPAAADTPGIKATGPPCPEKQERPGAFGVNCLDRQFLADGSDCRERHAEKHDGRACVWHAIAAAVAAAIAAIIGRDNSAAVMVKVKAPSPVPPSPLRSSPRIP